MGTVVATSAAPVSDLDPFDEAVLLAPHPMHAALRDAGPVVRLSRYGCLAVARHAEVSAVLQDWGAFSSARGVGLDDFARTAPWRPPSLILEADPPAHTRTRAVLTRVLSPAVVRDLRERFAAAADRLAAELAERRRFDAIADLAEAYPMSVFPDAVGLPREGREHLLPYAATVFNAFGPDNALRRRALAEAGPHMAWVAAQCRRENLAPGGFGAAIHAAAEAGEIAHDEAPLLVRSLLSAGLDTTVHSLGAAAWCLARSPDQFAALRAEPGRAKAAFEEAIRLESPVQTFFRTTTRPVEVGGVAVGEGEKVLMLLAAANRDPRRWERPDAYDIRRRAVGHVGFGGGIHMCVGQLLARLEGEVMLAAMARRWRALRVAGEAVAKPNNTLRGLARLPVEVEAA